MSGVVGTALRFGYGRSGRTVLDGVDIALASGDIVAIVGPNGCGKSTLLKVLLGVLEPAAGRVKVDETEVAAMSATERSRRLVYVPQRASVVMGFSVAEYAGLGIVGKSRTGAVERALARLELSDRAADRFDDLSAGQQQRATLARALVQLDTGGARVLLADEPTSAMDPRHQLLCAGVLRELASRGVAVAVVLHDLTLARELATRAVVMSEAGRVAAAGTASDVLVPDVLDGVFGVRFVERVGLVARGFDAAHGNRGA